MSHKMTEQELQVCPFTKAIIELQRMTWNQLFCNSEHDQKLLTTWGVLLQWRERLQIFHKWRTYANQSISLVPQTCCSCIDKAYVPEEAGWCQRGQWNPPKVWGHTVWSGGWVPEDQHWCLPWILTLLANLFYLAFPEPSIRLKETEYTSPCSLFRVKHLRKSGPMSGHWQTAEKMEQKLQWPQKNKEYTFCKNSL